MLSEPLLLKPPWEPHEDPRCVSEVSLPLEDKDQYFNPI